MYSMLTGGEGCYGLPLSNCIKSLPKIAVEKLSSENSFENSGADILSVCNVKCNQRIALYRPLWSLEIEGELSSKAIRGTYC